MVNRVFLGSGTHLLPSLAAWLLEQHAASHVLDCSAHMVVLPTGRARRRLEQLLIEQAGDRMLVPPELTTPSGLLDRFLIRECPRADDLTSQLAWLEALNRASESTLKAVTGHDTPPTRREATSLASRLQRLLKELGGGGYTPEEVLKIALESNLPVDVPRWTGLQTLWSDVQSILRSANRIDSDVARRHAIESAAVQNDGIEQISIVSASPSRLLGRLLHLLDRNDVRVNTIIHGDADELEDAFDDLGAVDVDTWVNRPIDLSECTVVSCDRVDDQAAAVLERFADKTDEDDVLNAEEIAVVVPDDEFVGMLVRELQQFDVPVPVMSVRGAGHGRICRLLQILGDHLEDAAARHFGDMLRHPDVEQYLQRRGIGNPVATWDDLWNRHFPRSLPDLPEGSKAHVKFTELLGDLLVLIDPLHGAPRTASEWVRPLMHVLATLVSASETPLEEHDRQDLNRVRDVMESQLDLGAGSEITACELILLLVNDLQSDSSWRTSGSGIAIIGWLDAHLDDSDELIITGLNEGILPSRPSVDAWLPDRLRECLGLDSERRRLARDSWLLHAILSSQRNTTLVSAQHAMQGEPLPPSRLLLRTSGDSLALRIRELSSVSESMPRLSDWQDSCEIESGFPEQPLPSGNPLIKHLSVTSFKRFLDDPLSFLLERDQRIRAGGVETLESMDAAGFGSLVHTVLERWGEEEASRSGRTEDPESINQALQSILVKHADSRFGLNPSAGIRVQIAIAAHRLEALALAQAQRAREGWKIALVEANFGRGNAPIFPLEGGLPLHGKIDRVDLHEELGYQALDYKTGSKPDNPVKTHQTRNGWKDLQLPLYRVLLNSIDIKVPPQGLGYFHVPPDGTVCGVSMAPWKESDLEDAVAEAERIVGIITSGNLLAEVEASL